MDITPEQLEQCDNLLDFLKSNEFRKLFIPYVLQRQIEVANQVLNEDKDDERNRGYIKALKWIVESESRVAEANRKLHMKNVVNGKEE